MKATIVDLRYKMKDILKALDRNEQVTILYHGKEKGVITPAKNTVKSEIKDHPFFGMSKNKEKTVNQELEDIRRSRSHDF